MNDMIDRESAIWNVERQEQKIGHWIELETWLGRGVICSECEKLALHQVWSDGCGEIECEYAKSNYCPSCGIKMEVENDGRHN